MSIQSLLRSLDCVKVSKSIILHIDTDDKIALLRRDILLHSSLFVVGAGATAVAT